LKWDNWMSVQSLISLGLERSQSLWLGDHREVIFTHSKGDRSALIG
jgi:hypothetical protein